VTSLLPPVQESIDTDGETLSGWAEEFTSLIFNRFLLILPSYLLFFLSPSIPPSFSPFFNSYFLTFFSPFFSFSPSFLLILSHIKSTPRRDEIFPRLMTFKPDLIFISAGFDAHKKDTINSG
jgi:hypothetical protein